MRFSKLTLTALVMLASALGPGSAAYADDAVAQFSSVSNPNGNWSYGQTPTLGGAFSLLSSASCGSLHGWAAGSAPTAPWVLGNPTGTTQTCGTGQVPPTLLDMHPGQNGQLSDVRWKTPSSGTYQISGLFEGIDPTVGGTDVHVLLDGVSIFSGEISTFDVPLTFNLTRALVAGDILDFAVGFGTDGNFLFDSTGFDATIVSSIAVPEPSSALTLLTALAGLLGLIGLRGRLFA